MSRNTLSSKSWRLRGMTNPSHIFETSEKALSEELENVCELMHKSPLHAIQILQAIMARVSHSWTIKQWMTRWVDARGLDLLQCAIINNKPHLVRFLLEEAKLFPESYFPKLNPYAHVAATVGSVDCLDTLLSLRPDDYFEASDLSHKVKLPVEVIKRLKLGSSSGMVDRKLDRIVKIVKGQITNVEERLKKSGGESIIKFEEELKKFEASLNDTKQKPRKRFTYPSSMPQKSTSQSKNQTTRNDTRLEFPFLRTRRRKQSKVTVYRDVFRDDSLDRDKVIEEKASGSLDTKVNFLSKLTIAEIQAQKKQFARDSLPSSRFSTTSSGSTQSKSKELKTRTSRRSSNSSLSKQLEKPEIGIRKYRKYKDFVPVFEQRPTFSDESYIGKTPLILAAEKNHHECVHYLLRKYHLQKENQAQQKDSLTLAASARVPEAIAVILKRSVTITEYQNAVMLSLRELYPDSLNVLLTLGMKYRRDAFGGVNLYHILYSQSLQTNYGYEMLPEMTRVLISSQENVNSRHVPSTYPLYTLIQSAFNVTMGRNSLYYLKCLEMILKAKANPHFNETNQSKLKKSLDITSIGRSSYVSAIHCVLLNANTSFEHFEVRYWSQIIMQKFIETIEHFDQTPRRIHNDILFLYMSYVRKLGLNIRVIRALLRYGANPDHVIDGQFALNVYFEEMIPFFTRFKVTKKGLTTTDNTLSSLLYVCKAMSQSCLRDCVIHFLDHHLLYTPLQALEITRKFCYYTNKMIMSPRTLTHITSNMIWLTCGRNAKSVRSLPIPEDAIQMIIP